MKIRKVQMIDVSNYDEELPDSVPEIVNGEERGVNFAAWLSRDPKKKLKGQKASYELDLSDIQAVANDLHAKGLLPAGDYVIDIDW